MTRKIWIVLLALGVVLVGAGFLVAQSGHGPVNPPPKKKAIVGSGSPVITTKLGYHAAVLEDGLSYPAGIGVSVTGDTVYFTDYGGYVYRDRKHTIKGLWLDTYDLDACRMKMALFVGDGSGDIFQVTDDGKATLFSQVSSDLYIPALDVDLSTGAVYFVAQYEDFYSALYKVPAGGGKAIFITDWYDYPSWGLAVKGNYLYATSYYDDTVYKFPKNGNGSWTEVLSGLDGPTDIQFDKAGNMFIAEYGGGTLDRVQAGTTKPVPIVSGMDEPFYLQLDGAGNVYLSDYSGGRIYRIWK